MAMLNNQMVNGKTDGFPSFFPAKFIHCVENQLSVVMNVQTDCASRR